MTPKFILNFENKGKEYSLYCYKGDLKKNKVSSYKEGTLQSESPTVLFPTRNLLYIYQF